MVSLPSRTSAANSHPCLTLSVDLQRVHCIPSSRSTTINNLAAVLNPEMLLLAGYQWDFKLLTTDN